MHHSRLALSLCLALALGVAGCDDENESAAFTGTLNAASAVPPNQSTATGSVTIDYDGEGESIQYRLEVQSMTAITGAHIHSGAAGASGPARVTLFDGPTTGDVSGVLAEGTFSSAEVQGMGFEALVDEMRNGNAYIDVHTSAYPDGEIRAQVRLQSSDSN